MKNKRFLRVFLSILAMFIAITAFSACSYIQNDFEASVEEISSDELANEMGATAAADSYLTTAEQQVLFGWGYSFGYTGTVYTKGTATSVTFFLNDNNNSIGNGTSVSGIPAMKFGDMYFMTSRYYYEMSFVLSSQNLEFHGTSKNNASRPSLEDQATGYLTLSLNSVSSASSILKDENGYAYINLPIHLALMGDRESTDGRLYFLKSGPAVFDNNDAPPSDTTSKLSVDISTCTVSLSATTATYNGKSQLPTVTVMNGSTRLNENTDYTLSYSTSDFTSQGTKTITVTGKGIYTNSVSSTFTISALSLSGVSVIVGGGTSGYTYTGSEIKPAVVVVDRQNNIIPSTSYSVTYLSNINAGTASIIINSSGSNTSSYALASFKINMAVLSKPTAGTNTLTYNEESQTYLPQGFNASTMDITGNTQINAGSYDAKVTLKDTTNYAWSGGGTELTYSYTINQRQLSLPTHNTQTFTYTGSAQTYTPTGFNASTMNIDGNEQTDADEYTVTVTLKDTDNNIWADEEDDPQFTFKIAKANQSFTVSQSTIEVLTGRTTITVSGSYVDGKFTYDTATKPTGYDAAVATIAADGSVTAGNKVGSTNFYIYNAGDDNHNPLTITATLITTLTNGYFTGSLTGANTCYATFAQAVAGSAENSTVYAKGTVSLGGAATVNKNITLRGYDTNAVINRVATAEVITVASGKTLTINSLTFDGKKLSSANSFIVANGTLSLNTVKFKNFISTGNGSVINGGAASTVNISGGEFSDNKALGGGVIYTAGSVAVSNNASFSANTATNGGVIYGTANAKVTVTSGSFGSNIATQNGGVIYTEASASAITINGGTFSSNRAVQGGVIYAASPAQVSVNSGTFDSNTATDGGAVYLTQGASMTVVGGTFSANRATTSGGAICANQTNGTLVLSGGVLEGNRASYGGGVYLGSDGANALRIGAVTMTNNYGTIFGNGVYTAERAVSINGTTCNNVKDSIGIDGTAKINVTNGLTNKISVAFSSQAVASYAQKVDKTNPDNLIGDQTDFVTNSASLSGSDLKKFFGVSNPGYTFGVDDAKNTLFLRESVQIAAVIIDRTGTIHEYKSIQEAINAASDTTLFGSSSKDSPITVYIVQQVNYGALENAELNFTVKEINNSLEIPADTHIAFDSILRHAKVEPYVGAEGYTMTSLYYNSQQQGEQNLTPTQTEIVSIKTATTIKRGLAFYGEMVKVAEGASLTLRYITLDGGASWTGGQIKITDDSGKAGSVKTVNNTGITAHAPVIVNAGNLVMESGASVCNNSNNYAAPGEGFGSQNYGGGIRNEGAGCFEMKGGQITLCYSREGGAIMNVNKPKLSDGSVNPTYRADGNPSVIITGGKISDNASQMKGAAIQTIYGGATTRVSGGTIENNYSLNNLGVLAVEEGGALTIEGGTISAMDSDIAVYVYNKYSEDDYSKAQIDAKPYIEGEDSNKGSENVAKLVVSGNPTLSGAIHIDKPCIVVNTDIYYEPVIQLRGYTGDTLNVQIESGRAYGRIAVSDSNNFDKLRYDEYMQGLDYSADAIYSLGSRYEKIITQFEGGGVVYVKIYGGFDMQVQQEVEGELLISGLADGLMEKLTFALGGSTYTLVAENGKLLGADGLPLKINLKGLPQTAFAVTDFEASYNGLYSDGGVGITPAGYTAEVLRFDWKTGKTTVTADKFTYDGNILRSGLIPDDLSIDSLGFAQFEVDGKEREIYLGIRVTQPTASEADATLTDITNNTITIAGKEDIEYNLSYTDNSGNEVHLLGADEWKSLPSGAESGSIVFGIDETLTASTVYTVIVRRKSREDGDVKYLPSKTVSLEQNTTLTDNQGEKKALFEGEYNALPATGTMGFEAAVDSALDAYYVLLNTDTSTAPAQTMQHIYTLLSDEYDRLIELKKELVCKNITAASENGGEAADEEARTLIANIYIGEAQSLQADNENGREGSTDKYVLDVIEARALAALEARAEYDNADKDAMRSAVAEELKGVLSTGLDDILAASTLEDTESERITAIDNLRRKISEGLILAYFDILTDDDRLQAVGITDTTALTDRLTRELGLLEDVAVGTSGDDYDSFTKKANLALDRAEGVSILTEYVANGFSNGVIEGILSAANQYIEDDISGAASGEDIDSKVAQAKLDIEKERAKVYITNALGDNPPVAAQNIQSEYNTATTGVIDEQDSFEKVWYEAEKAVGKIELELRRDELYSQIEIADKGDDAEIANMKGLVDSVFDVATDDINGVVLAEDTPIALDAAKVEINDIVSAAKLDITKKLNEVAKQKIKERIQDTLDNLTDNLKTHANIVTEQADYQVESNEYELLPLIMDKTVAKLDAIIEYGNDKDLLVDKGLRTDKMEGALSDALSLIEEAVQDASGDNNVTVKADEAHERLVLGQAECFMESFPQLTKDYDEINATDFDRLSVAEETYLSMPSEVIDTLDDVFSEEYTTVGSLIADRIDKSQFEAMRDEIKAKVKKLVREHDGEKVLTELDKQFARLDAVPYEPQTDDNTRDDYFAAQVAELNAVGDAAMDLIGYTQYHQVNVNSLQESIDFAKGDNYTYDDADSSHSILDRIMHDAEMAIESVYLALAERPTDEELERAKGQIDSIVTEAHDKVMDEIQVTGVSSGGIKPDKTPVGATDADYPDNLDDSELWGIVTNDTKMEGGIRLVIEKTDSEIIELIAEAVKEGRLIAATGSNTADAKALKNKVKGKEVKSTLDIYLLKHNSSVKITEFNGKYIVKILLTEELRRAEGLQIVYVADDGTIEVYDTTIEDGKYLVFETYHFSEFYVLGEPVISLWWLIITLSLVLAFETLAILLIIRARNKSREEGENA